MPATLRSNATNPQKQSVRTLKWSCTLERTPPCMNGGDSEVHIVQTERPAPLQRERCQESSSSILVDWLVCWFVLNMQSRHGIACLPFVDLGQDKLKGSSVSAPPVIRRLGDPSLSCGGHISPIRSTISRASSSEISPTRSPFRSFHAADRSAKNRTPSSTSSPAGGGVLLGDARV